MRTVKFRNSEKTEVVGKIVCVGQNYADHIAEMGGEKPDFPVVFLKPTSALIYSGGEIIHPSYSNNLHHEAELVLLIGNKVKNASKEEAEAAIAGYTIGLDMTLRDLQKQYKDKGQPWTISKSFDTSAVVAEIIPTEERPLEGDENILLKVNNETRQDCSTSKLIYNPVEVVQYLSSMLTLEKGDLIFTGTPSGVSKVVPGDNIYAELSCLVHLDAKVVSDEN